MTNAYTNHPKNTTIWLFNSSPWKDPPIFKNGKPRFLPSISMAHLYHGEPLVITRDTNHCPVVDPQEMVPGFPAMTYPQ